MEQFLAFFTFTMDVKFTVDNLVLMTISFLLASIFAKSSFWLNSRVAFTCKQFFILDLFIYQIDKINFSGGTGLSCCLSPLFFCSIYISALKRLLPFILSRLLYALLIGPSVTKIWFMVGHMV